MILKVAVRFPDRKVSREGPFRADLRNITAQHLMNFNSERSHMPANTLCEQIELGERAMKVPLASIIGLHLGGAHMGGRDSPVRREAGRRP